MSATERVAELVENSKSFSGDASRVTTYADDYTVRGAGFLLQKNFTILTGASLLILLDYTTLVGLNKVVFLRPAQFSTTSGPVTVIVYRGTNYSGGTLLHAYNLNTIIGGESKLTLTEGPTGSVKGESALEWLVGTGSTNQSSGGGSTQTDVNIIRPNSGKTLMEVVNGSGKDIIFNISQILFELQF